MPTGIKSRAKVSGDSWQDFAKVVVRMKHGSLSDCSAEGEANLALIVAAPDMLQALEIAAKEIEIWQNGVATIPDASKAALSIVNKAIQKALSV